MAIKIVGNLNDISGKGSSNPDPIRKKWYSGDSPTTRDVLGRISEIYDNNKLAGTFYSNQFFKLQEDSSSPFYDPYTSATNKAIKELASYGVDTSVIDDNFFSQNDYLRKYLKYNGQTNTPSSPGKKATTAEKAAYAYYQIWNSEEATKKAEQQWKSLQDELSYWAKRTDRNYSDDEIINKIDWSKYSELTSMDKNKLMKPNEYNRSIGYSKDAMYGVIWAARNNGGTGDNYADMAMSARGKGNVWQDNPKIDNLLNPDSKEFLPYAVGSTNLDDAAYHFGVQSFDKDWIQQNNGIQWNGTDEDRKFYNQVITAEENTTSAENALDGLNKWIAKNRDRWDSIEDAQGDLDKILSRGEVTVDGVTYDLGILNKMDASIGKGNNPGTGNLIPMTRGVDYKYGNIVNELNGICEENANIPDGTEIFHDTFDYTEEPEPEVSEWYHDTFDEGPEDTEWHHDTFDYEEEKAEPEAVAKPEQPVAKEPTTPLANITPADVKRNRQERNGIFDTVATLGETVPEEIKTTMTNTAGSFWDDIKDGFIAVGEWAYNQVESKVTPLISKWADQAADVVSNGCFQTTLKQIKTVDQYNTIKGSTERSGNMIANFEKQYGSIDDYMQGMSILMDADKPMEISLGDTGFTAGIRYNRDVNVYELVDVIDPYGYDASESDELNAYQAEQIAAEAVRQRNEETRGAREAMMRYNSASAAEQQEIDYMRQVKVTYDQGTEYLEENKEQYDQLDKEIAGAHAALELVRTVNSWLGKDTSEFDEMFSMMDIASNYIDEPPIICKSETNLQDYETNARMYGVNYTIGMESEYLHKKLDAIDAEIEQIGAAKDYLTNHAPDEKEDTVSMNGPTTVVHGNDWYRDILKNMDYKVEDLQYDRKQAEYETLLTDVDAPEFYAAVDAGKAFENQFLGPDAIISEDTLIMRDTLKMAHDNYLDKSYIATENDQLIYYYLLGKQAQANGKEYNALMSDPARSAERDELVSEIVKDASDYISHMSDPDRGVWISRINDETERIARKAVNNGSDTGILANIVATGSTIFQGPISLVELGKSLFLDERISENGSGRRISKFKNAVREETFKSIKNTYGEGSIQEKLASLFYEMYVNRGDSLMNSIAWGWIADGLPNMAEEFVGSLPMGFTAAYDAMSDAIGNGADMDQAWLIGGTTLLFETATEALTYGNIKEAFGTAQKLGKDGLKEFFKNWITKSGIEEMIGESVTEVAEKWADMYAESMKDNEFKSQHTKRVEYYRSMGKSDEDAEWLATQDDIKDIGHTAFVSYLSPGADVFVKTGKAAYNSINTYRRGTKADQKLGGSRSTLGNMVDALRSQSGIAQDEAVEQTETSQPEANVVVPEQVTTEQKEVATDVVTLQKADTSNESTKAAAMAAVLSKGNNGKTDLRAEATAVHIAEVFGDDASLQIQRILTEAARTGVDVNTVKNAIKYATIGNGAATALVKSEAFQNANDETKAKMLADTVKKDSKSKTVSRNTNAAILDYRRGRVLNGLAVDGHFDKAKADRKVADQKAEENASAKAEVTARTDAAQEANNAAVEANQRVIDEKASDDSLHAQDAAMAKVQATEEVEKQAKQHQEKTEQAQQEAEEQAEQSAAEATRTGLEIADQKIAQEDQAQAEAEAAEAEQQRLAEEEQARLQAEEDEQTGKAAEERLNVMVEQILDNEGLEEGEERDQRRDELLDKAETVKIRIKDLKSPVSGAEGALAMYAFERKLGVPIRWADLGKDARGMYKDGVIYLNKNLQNKMSVGQAIVEASLHEITHSMEGTNAYKAYRNVVLESVFGVHNAGDAVELYNTNADFRAKVDALMLERAEAGDPNFTGDNINDKIAAAEKEIIADFARLNLAEKDVVQRFMDNGLGGKMRNILHNINQALKNYFKDMTDEERKTAEYLRKAERAFQKAMNEAAKNSEHPEGSQFSIAQFAQAANMTFNPDTLQLYDQNGVEIDGVNNKITPEMMDNTPVGMLINSGLTGEQQTAAKEMMAGLMNMVARYKDSNLVWEIGATTLNSTFSALKSNSDPQYKTTVDFGTVCAKTQAIIDTLSQVMLDKVKNGENGGLTREDVIKVYNAVNKAGLSVPCPVCYVFSRWMGVPSLLGQMSRYQHEYVVTNEDGSINKEATQDKVDEYIRNAEEKYGDAKAINKKKTSLQNKLTSLEDKRVELETKARSKDLTDAEKADIQNQLDNVLDQMVDIDNQIGEVDAYNWITQALCKEENGKFVVDDAFQLTPDEILFDLNRTGEFAGYAKNWKYRNTRGAGMGKAIMPYSGETIGDILYGVKKDGRQSNIKNPWLNMDGKAAARQLRYAQDRAKKQNLVGGQRLQSTSDFRPEWGLDYIMSFLELQAAGSKVQMYTKVAEAVDFFASVGADVNLSIMGKGQGWHIDEDGNYVLDFSDVTGMNYETAKALKDKYDNVQMILVGMNDTHIRLALKNSDIDFVIPWHSSGNSKEVLSGLISAVGEKLDSSVDYSTTQSDTVSENQTEEQKALWDARMKLLTKGNKALTQADRQVLLSNPYTAELYKRFTEKGYDDDCYGVKLSKDQASQIFPYEYWDTSLTKDQADENGRRFVEYCESMGIVPRFSQFKDDEGYWKLLIDRPMYNNDGTYHQQSVIDVTNARIGELNDEGKLTDSDLPTQAQAKYRPSDPRNPNYAKYTEAQKNAVENAEAAIRTQYNDGSGQQSVYGEMTEADLDTLDEGQLSTGGEETEVDIDSVPELTQAMVNSGQITKAELAEYRRNQTRKPLEGQRKDMSTDEGTKIRAFAAEDGMLQNSDEIDEFVKKVVEAKNTYFPDTNAEQVIRAVKWIRSLKASENSDGYAEAVRAVTQPLFDYRSADGQARMVAVMGMAVAKGDTIAQTQIADAFMRQGTDLGRALQARKLFKLMTPEGRMSTLSKMLDDYNADLKKNGMEDFKFSDWIMRAAAYAETAEDFRKVEEAAAAELAANLPISWKERLRSFRMLSMLMNPRTHIRNVVGNALFVPTVGIKNKIGALLEKGFVKKGERTKTLVPILNKEIREFARQDAKTMQDTLTGEAKYDEHGLVERAKNPLGVFGFLSDFNSKALEAEDWFFLKGHYRRALGSWMQANGYTVEQVQNDPVLLEKGREYAINEAQKATYRDFNKTAQWLNQASRNGGVGGFLVDAVLPFKKTPANILRRGVEYSPAGIAKGLYSLGRKMIKGDITANQVIDELSSGLSGTAVLALGYLLAGSGAVSCGLGDDDDWLEELKGAQKYSIHMDLFGQDVTYTMDWAAPMAMPFFVGAALRDQADREGWDVEEVLNAIGSITEPVFNLSMLDGVNSLLKVNSYSDENPITQILGKIATNYASSYVPSVLGAIARTVDDTQRKSFVTKGENNGVMGQVRYVIESAENKIPGLSQTNIPVRDVWGNAKTSSLAERIIENWISPGYIEQWKDDPVINEIGRLFDKTGSPALEPKHADKTIKDGGVTHNLGPDEWDTYDRVHGQTQYQMLYQLVNDPEYQNLTDDDAKVEIVDNIYKYATKVAKNAVFPSMNYTPETVSSMIKGGKVSSYTNKAVQALRTGDAQGYSDMLDLLEDEGVDPKSTVKGKIGDSYRDEWKEAYKNYVQASNPNERQRYRDEMDDIEYKLNQSGFDYNIYDSNGWQAQVDKTLP